MRGWLPKNAAFMLPFALLVLTIVAVPLLILDSEGLPRYRALSAELKEVDVENERLAREVDTLKRQVESLRDDPSTVERIARDELGMVRDDELVFQFPR